jgi:hypothetical protein
MSPMRTVALLVLVLRVDGGLWKRPALDGSRPDFMRVSRLRAPPYSTSDTPRPTPTLRVAVSGRKPAPSSDREPDKDVFGLRLPSRTHRDELLEPEPQALPAIRSRGGAGGVSSLCEALSCIRNPNVYP